MVGKCVMTLNQGHLKKVKATNVDFKCALCVAISHVFFPVKLAITCIRPWLQLNQQNL